MIAAVDGMSNEIKIDIPADVPRDTLKFFQRVLGPFADASDFLGDKVRFYRWKSAIKTLQRAEEFAKASPVKNSDAVDLRDVLTDLK